MGLTIGSCFAGIGGFELGLEWAGLGPVLWQVELDEGCRRTLARHWPDARRISDVRHAPYAALPAVDVLCAGFPCQDLSQANPQGAGLDGPRSGLFWALCDLIDELRPPIIALENVARLVRRGLDRVVGALEARGYAVEATRIRAEDVGAPHRRERLFILAYADGARRSWPSGPNLCRPQPPAGGGAELAQPVGLGAERRREPVELDSSTGARAGEGAERQRHGDATGDRRSVGVGLADPDSGRRQELRGADDEPALPRRDEPVRRDGAGMGDAGGERREGLEHAGAATAPAVEPDGAWLDRAAEPAVGRGADGLPAEMDRRLSAALGGQGRWPAPRGAEQHPWEPPRLRPRQPGDRARLKALGNAVVPHCAYVVGMRIRQLVEDS